MTRIDSTLAALIGAFLLLLSGCIDPATGQPPVNDDDDAVGDDDDAVEPVGTATFQVTARNANGDDLGGNLTVLTGEWNELETLGTTMTQDDGITYHVLEIDRDGNALQMHLYAQPCAPRALWVCATEDTLFTSYEEMGSNCDGGTESDGIVDEALDHNLSGICTNPVQAYLGQSCSPNNGGFTWNITVNGAPSDPVYAVLNGYQDGLGTSFSGLIQGVMYVNGYELSGEAGIGTFTGTIDPATDCFEGTVEGGHTVTGCRQ